MFVLIIVIIAVAIGVFITYISLSYTGDSLTDNARRAKAVTMRNQLSQISGAALIYRMDGYGLIGDIGPFAIGRVVGTVSKVSPFILGMKNAGYLNSVPHSAEGSEFRVLVKNIGVIDFTDIDGRKPKLTAVVMTRAFPNVKGTKYDISDSLCNEVNKLAVRDVFGCTRDMMGATAIWHAIY